MEEKPLSHHESQPTSRIAEVLQGTFSHLGVREEKNSVAMGTDERVYGDQLNTLIYIYRL